MSVFHPLRTRRLTSALDPKRTLGRKIQPFHDRLEARLGAQGLKKKIDLYFSQAGISRCPGALELGERIVLTPLLAVDFRELVVSRSRRLRVQDFDDNGALNVCFHSLRSSQSW